MADVRRINGVDVSTGGSTAGTAEDDVPVMDGPVMVIETDDIPVLTP